jgi:hypothetical protein
MIGKSFGRTILRKSISYCCWQPGQNSRNHGHPARNAASSVGENSGRASSRRITFQAPTSSMANRLRAASTWRGSAGSPSGGGTNPNCAPHEDLGPFGVQRRALRSQFGGCCRQPEQTIANTPRPSTPRR